MLISPQKSHRQPRPRSGALCASGLEDGNLSGSGALATGSDIARKLWLRLSRVYRVSSGEISGLALMVSADHVNDNGRYRHVTEDFPRPPSPGQSL